MQIGIIHRTREQHQKINKVVYGLSTDSNQFQFWRLDNASQVGDQIYFLMSNTKEISSRIAAFTIGMVAMGPRSFHIYALLYEQQFIYRHPLPPSKGKWSAT